MVFLIAVIGSDGEITNEVKEMSEKIGRDIAENKCILLCGGRGGVMEAACKGAKSRNGITVGLLPSYDKNDANPYVDIPLALGVGHVRNSLIACSADAVIAICGRTGTLSEIALALTYNKPVIAVKGSGGAAELKLGFSGIYVVEAENAVKFCLELLKEKVKERKS